MRDDIQMFCPKCGSILRLKKDGNKRVMACSCGYVDKSKEQAKLTEKLEEKKEIDVVEKSEDDILPLMDTECPKCGHKKAHYWLVQTRAGDEPETKFLRCEKCKHTWRDYN